MDGDEERHAICIFHGNEETLRRVIKTFGSVETKLNSHEKQIDAVANMQRAFLDELRSIRECAQMMTRVATQVENNNKDLDRHEQTLAKQPELEKISGQLSNIVNRHEEEIKSSSRKIRALEKAPGEEAKEELKEGRHWVRNITKGLILLGAGALISWSVSYYLPDKKESGPKTPEVSRGR